MMMFITIQSKCMYTLHLLVYDSILLIHSSKVIAKIKTFDENLFVRSSPFVDKVL